MRFPELIIENFLAITEAKINLADRGLVVIQGENHADTSANSNGAGKSSIPDALCWCWFGTTARGITGDDVINDDAKKDCRVVSVVTDGHMTYTATRHRKHKSGKNTLTITAHDGLKLVDLTKGTEKLTQEVADQIIGSSLEVFSGSIYAGQEKMPDLPAMTDKNLKVLIEEAAGVTVLEGAYQKAREYQNDAQKAVGVVEASAKSVKEKMDWISDQIVIMEKDVTLWETDRQARLAALKSEAMVIVPKVKQFVTDVAAMEALGLEKQIAECDAKITAVGGENATLMRLEGEAQRLLGNYNHTKFAADKKLAEIPRAESAVKDIAHKVGCPCDECGRPLTEAELDAASKAAAAQLSTIKAEADRLAFVADNEKTNAESAISARDAFKLTMTDISAVSAQRASLLAQLASYNELLKEQGVIQAQARALRDKIAVVTAEANPISAKITSHEAELDKLNKEYADLAGKLGRARDKLMLEEAAVKVFGPTGVRARVLDEVTPFLNGQSSKYLSILSDGNLEAVWTTLTKNAKGEFREKFTIDVSNATGGKMFKGLSGGEKRKARIATALALQDLVATRASKPIDLFIGDEIDDALDPAGLERLMIILEEKARERGSVFVISHNELRDEIKQVLLIEKMPDRKTRITESVS